MKQKHTPTPWAKTESFQIVKPQGNTALELADICYVGDEAVAEANAEFIVRACNAHDELVEALQKCLESAHAADSNVLHSFGSLVKAIQHYARPALAKARGEE